MTAVFRSLTPGGLAALKFHGSHRVWRGGTHGGGCEVDGHRASRGYNGLGPGSPFLRANPHSRATSKLMWAQADRHVMHQLSTVTIAIPTYNRVTYLRQAIQSALSQTYSPIQVIVSDNCSQDGTAEYVSRIRDERLLILRQEKNLGMAGNWNACLEKAVGEYFLLLSDDDYLEEKAIERLVEAVAHAEQPDRVGLAYCRMWEVNQDGRKLRISAMVPPCEEGKEFALEYFLRKRELHPCATLFRTADLRQIGGYSQGSVSLAMDAIVWSRILLKRGLIVGVAEPLANYRVHRTNAASSSRIELWQSEIGLFRNLWSEAFRDSPANVRRRFHRAARNYEGWVIAAFINQGAASWSARIRAMGTYYDCRKSFVGLSGKINVLVGLAKLLVPETIKRPIRSFLLSRQGVERKACASSGS